LILTSNAKSISQNNSTYFLASGGVAPYGYSIVAGGVAGSSINPSSGLYTSGSGFGVDIIRAIDSSVVPVVVDLPISILSPIEILCDILQTEMSLGSDQIWLWDQKEDIPTDSRIYVVVGILTCKPFANTNYFDGTNSIQSTNFSATISIDIFSRSIEALSRKEEIVMALNSNYSQKQQEANSFYIAKLSSSFVNISYQEGVSMLYRFNISVNMQYSVKKVSAPEYYDTFQANSLIIDN
jgi:hypothetical protein